VLIGQSVTSAAEISNSFAEKRINGEPLEDLLHRHYTGSLRLARSILREENEAADAVQAAYGNALRHLDGFREDSTFGTWISRIVVNQCLMRLRQLKRAPAVSIESIPVEPQRPLFSGSRLPGPHEVFEQKEAAVAIDHALRNLPETLRRAFLLYEVEGASMRDISQALGISVAAAKSRLFRARAELRRLLSVFMGVRQTFA
jgi:RNA polymerase sigma-70 factor (ECF subfamily)